MKAWLIFGSVSGTSFGGWVSQSVQGLDTVTGLALGLGLGLVVAVAFASIP